MYKHLESVECHEMASLGCATPREVSSIIDMYSFYLKQEKPECQGIGKIVVIYSDKDEIISDGNTVQIIRSKKSDINDPTQELDRESYLINFYNILIEYLAECSIDTYKFHLALNEVKKRNFIFCDVWGKKKWNKSRSLSADVEWHFSDKIKLHFLVSNKNEDVRRYFISSLAPGLGVLDFCLGGIKWIDNENVTLLQSNKRDYWQLDLKGGDVQFHYARAESGDAHGEYDLGMMYASGNSFLEKNFEKSLFWIELAAQKNFGRAIDQLKKMKIS
ncbi:SEL1-like repeat protein [Burkholderia pyrrocinia]|uniref:SEL1-like repeat protein n=1 Tax=Burkholderia pyrrocinia TaxID=60550 RepID=UPI002AB28B92|nr:SEL1-like repeat protein [Burkholderia pyrrocinia]